MSEKNFTDEQLSAINTRDKTLLVSAAAGSGKTATLTERIIRSLTDEENPEDISRMLIVTFTNAAVKELRDRITAALKKKLSENKDDKRLESQLYMLPSARISTIDSFCNDILRNNTEKFGISPKYRIADPIEAKILAHSVWSALIDGVYSGKLSDVASPEEVEELAACLTGVKHDSELEEVLDTLYSKSKSLKDGVEVFRRFAEEMKKCKELPIEKNKYADYAMRRTKEAALHYIETFRKLTERLLGGAVTTERIDEIRKNISAREEIKNKYSGKTQKAMLAGIPELTYDEKYTAALYGDIALLKAVTDAKTYAEMQKALDISFSAMPSIKGEKTDAQLQTVAARDAMKDTLAKSKERYFTYSEDEWYSHIEKLSELLFVLSALIEKFDKMYFEEKNSRSMLEYSDIERFTYKSLYDGDKPSELALALREEFSSVYIDEYQDVNALQNEIFLAVSRNNNRFTVGDIKQSIYGFRSACPEIFADMKRSYPSLENAKDSDTASIFMSKNFRCDREIIDFTNAIFDKMFELAKESIGYVSDDRLCFAKIHDKEAPGHHLPEVKLFAKPPRNNPNAADGDDGNDGDDEDALTDSEPKWVAEKIRELIDGEYLNNGDPISPSNIAIVLRNGGKRFEQYSSALGELGIKSRAPENKNFFLNAEIQLVLCLLNSINNPMKDIYLAGLMLSPIFNFTPDEVYFARALGKKHTLWESVLAYSEAHPEYTKFSSFISTLNRYRAIAEGMRADALIMRLYNECGLFALAAKDGCRENLMVLYNYARKFEASSFEGLYNFINYINTVIESGAEFTSGKESESEDAVTITTVHKSKGLEYPVVFLASASSKLISKKERSVRVAWSDDYGIGIRTRVPGGLALVASPIYNAIIDKNCDKSVEEELRVYYVALTRARERLYITGSPETKSKEEYIAAAEAKKIHQSHHTLREMKTFIDILHAVNTEAIVSWEEDKSDTGADDVEFYQENAPIISDTDFDSKANTDSGYDEELYKLLSERFSYKYPASHLTKLPEKMSVSNLYPTVLDGTAEEPRLTIDAVNEEGEKDMRAILPRFIPGSTQNISAEQGIATHNFLQFFDIAALDTHGPAKELERLVDEHFISKKNADRVRMNEIELFFKSELYKQMKSAKRLYREFRFSVMLPAALFTSDEDKKAAFGKRKILLQGVMDCIIEDTDGKLHLIDYKTDRLSKEELLDKALAAEALKKKHSLQLSYYARAIEKIFGKAPTTVRVYSLPLGDTVDV